MELKITINCDGSAFKDDMMSGDDWFFLSSEVKRLLKKISQQIEDGNSYGSCIDLYGNKVGQWRFDD